MTLISFPYIQFYLIPFSIFKRLHKGNNFNGPFLLVACPATAKREFNFKSEVPRSSGYLFGQPWKDKKLSQPWGQTMVNLDFI